MNNIVILAALFGLMTIGTASILYSSFRGRADTSAGYFLLAELIMLPAILLVALMNLDLYFYRPSAFFLSNFCGFISEISIVFSILALTKKLDPKKFGLAIVGALLYALFMELCRSAVSPKFPILLGCMATAILSFTTYRICKSFKNSELANNRFLKWLGNVEIGLGLFALLRIGSYFSSTPISTLNPPPGVSLLYTVFITLSIFRYIAYHSLRISWVDPRSSERNALNANLAKALDEKDQLLNSLIASNRVLGISALANSLAHQLSQPLTGIALQTETLKRNLAESSQHDASVNSLNKIARQLGKLSELVKNLRQLFSFKTTQFKTINLQEISNEILEIIEPALKEKQISLIRNYASDVEAYGDAIQIQQVLINLFNNAIDSIALSNVPHREIIFTVSQKEGFASISIEDSGAGIDINLLPNIFDLYKTTKKEGLGVGLWLSKTIIDKHDGKIFAANRKDSGAIFEIELPLAGIED